MISIPARHWRIVGTVAALWASLHPATAQEVATLDPVHVPARAGTALTLKVTYPTTGRHLPIVIFSHGGGLSRVAYAPLITQLAQSGMVVVQVDHPDSTQITRTAPPPSPTQFWSTRADQIDDLVRNAGNFLNGQRELAKRLDTRRVALIGHSFGGHSVQIVNGAQVRGHVRDGPGRHHRRVVKASVLLAPPGNIAGVRAERRGAVPYLDVDRSAVRGPTLVIVGGQDGRGPMVATGAAWHEDPFHAAPPHQRICIVRRMQSGHYLGGIDGLGRASPAELASDEAQQVGAIVIRYLKSKLARRAKDREWDTARDAATCT